MGGEARPAFLVVDDDPEAVVALQEALNRRLGADYQIIAESSPERGLSVLERLRESGGQVAAVIADQWMPRMTGTEFLLRAHQIHPDARRALITDIFDRFRSADPISQAMALGRADTWLVKPWGPADHYLYPRVSELLDDWVQATGQRGVRAMRIVADPRAPRTHELRDILDRSSIPAEFVAPDSPQGRQLLTQAGQDGTRLPVVVYLDRRVQVNPSDTEIVDALGISTRSERDRYDVTVVGAGPAGLSAALCSASEGLHTLLLEPCVVGGQAGSTSMIRNYLGFPYGVSGRQLTKLALEQARLFGARFVYDRATRLQVHGAQRVLTLAGGGQVSCDAVVISVGVEYARLAAPGVDDLLGAGVFYGAAVSEAPATRGQPVYVVGGGNSAGQAAIYLAKYAEHVTILVRGPSLSATMSDYLIRQIKVTPNITVRSNTQVASAGGAGRLEHLTLHDTATGRTEQVAAFALFILIGARPNTDWLAETLARDAGGFLLTGPDLCPAGTLPDGWPLDRPPLPMETSVPGVFAAGDVRHGSTKRVAAAVGDGGSAIQNVHQYLGALRPALQTA